MNRYWAAFWLVGFIYGTSFLLNAIALRELNSLEIGFLRYGLAGIGLLAIVWYQKRPFPRDRKSLMELALIGLGNHTLPFGLIVWAQTRVDSGLAAVFMATAPLYSLLVAHFIFEDERMTPQKVLGVFMAFTGIVLLSSRSLQEGGLSGSFFGEAVIIFAAAISAIATIYSRRVIRNKPDAVVMSTGAMLSSAIMMLAASFVLAGVQDGSVPAFLTGLSANIWLTMLVMAVVNTLLANTLFYYVIRGLGASRSTMVTYVFPPVSLVLGAVFLHEVIDARIIFGTFIILSGLAIVNMQLEQSFAPIHRMLQETR